MTVHLAGPGSKAAQAAAAAATGGGVAAGAVKVSSKANKSGRVR
jgi:hypothetical protein